MCKKIQALYTRTKLFLRSVDTLYHRLGLGSLAVLLMKVLVLNRIPAPLHFMSAVSPVIEGILGSVIASYIFYLFCIHPPVYAEKKTSAVFVNFILSRIKKSFEDHMQRLSPALNYEATKQDFYNAFAGCSPFACNAPLLIQATPQPIYADWFQFFQNENLHIQKEITRLMDSRLILGTEVTYILNRINDSAWFMFVQGLAGLKARGQLPPNVNPFVNTDGPELSGSTSMYELKELIKKLQPAIDETEKLKD